MVNNTLMVINGKKILVNRFGNSGPTKTVLSRFRVATNMSDITVSDTTIATQVPIQGTESVDDCSATTGWTASTSDSVTVNSSTFKYDSGTDGALNLIKGSVIAATVSASKTTTSLSGTSKDFLIWIYIKDAATLAKLLSAGTACVIRFGSDNSNYYYKNYTAADFAVGWNLKIITITSGFTGTTGAPVIGALDYTYIAFVTNNVTDTFAAGDIIFDSIRLASADDYYKNIESLTVDETDASVTILSKLTVSEANGFLINGLGLENTDSPALLGVKTKMTENSKSNTDLFKFTTKLKFRNVGE